MQLIDHKGVRKALKITCNWKQLTYLVAIFCFLTRTIWTGAVWAMPPSNAEGPHPDHGQITTKSRLQSKSQVKVKRMRNHRLGMKRRTAIIAEGPQVPSPLVAGESGAAVENAQSLKIAPRLSGQIQANEHAQIDTLKTSNVQGRIGASSFEPDSSLISVLQDLVRVMKSAKVLTKVEGADRQAVVSDASRILEKALASPSLTADRIIGLPGKGNALGALKTEAWASGEVEVNDELRGSLAAVWAKRPNGLINVTIAGSSPKEYAPNGKRIGQFVVVITGNSSVQTGLDIQSQADVDFWLAEVQHVAVESECFLAGPAPANTGEAVVAGDPLSEVELKKKSSPILGAVVTEREHHASEPREDKLNGSALSTIGEVKGIRIEEPKTIAAPTSINASGQQGQAAGSPAPTEQVNPMMAAAVTSDLSGVNANASVSAPATNTTAVSEISPAALPVTVKSTAPEATGGERLITVDNVVLRDGGTSEFKSKANADVVQEAECEDDAHLSLHSDTTTAVESDAVQEVKEAILLPQRAIAGQPVTVSILDDHKNGRANIQLNFNGASSTTDESGRAFFTVPEDAAPGNTLSVAVSIYPELSGKLVEVLQPLTAPSTPQSPRIDNVPALTAATDVLTIDGHNFDGICQHNRLLIDGVQPVSPVAASPLQLKAFIPNCVGPGRHTVCVYVNDKPSNEVSFQTFAIEVMPDGKHTSKSSANHLKIKIIGTQQQVPLHVVNQTPAIVVVAKGNDIHMTSPGGEKNFVELNLQRLRKGAFKIDAKLDGSI